MRMVLVKVLGVASRRPERRSTLASTHTSTFSGPHCPFGMQTHNDDDTTSAMMQQS
jgi:hypothetical protein